MHPCTQVQAGDRLNVAMMDGGARNAAGGRGAAKLLGMTARPTQSSQVKSSQVKSSQVKSSQVKSSQVKSSQEGMETLKVEFIG